MSITYVVQLGADAASFVSPLTPVKEAPKK